jgi:hypothetical protein
VHTKICWSLLIVDRRDVKALGGSQLFADHDIEAAGAAFERDVTYSEQKHTSRCLMSTLPDHRQKVSAVLRGGGAR